MCFLYSYISLLGRREKAAVFFLKELMAFVQRAEEDHKELQAVFQPRLKLSITQIKCRLVTT